jgi:hypothetical protein
MIDTTINRYAGEVHTGKRTVFVVRELTDVTVGTQPHTSDLGEYKVGATTLTGAGPLSADEKRAIYREITGVVLV